MIDSWTSKRTHSIQQRKRVVGIVSCTEDDVPPIADVVDFRSPKLVSIQHISSVGPELMLTFVEYGFPLPGLGMNTTFVSANSQLLVKLCEHFNVILSLVEKVNR